MKDNNFYWAMLSNALTKAECLYRKARSNVCTANLMIVPDPDPKYKNKFRLIRKIYYSEFGDDYKWRRCVRECHHQRVLKLLKRIRRK